MSSEPARYRSTRFAAFQCSYAAHDTNLLNTLAASANSSFVLTVKYNREPTISAYGTHP